MYEFLKLKMILKYTFLIKECLNLMTPWKQRRKYVIKHSLIAKKILEVRGHIANFKIESSFNVFIDLPTSKYLGLRNI